LAADSGRRHRRVVCVQPGRRLTKIIDPLGQETLFGYNRSGKLTSLTDPKGYITSWTYDVQGRPTTKQYADTSTVTYAYENTTSRLKSVTDALGQIKQYAYAKDDQLTGISYSNAVNPTPNVSFAYDPYFVRLTSMTDGNGTTQYSYVPVGSLGALKLQQEASPLPSSAITYAYDELGRLNSRTVAGAGAETFAYDTLGRLSGHTSDLGSFALSYLGQTEQITQRQLLPATANLETNWSYLNNVGDRRLAQIANVGLAAGQFSTFQFTTTPENFITAITETSDAPTVYPRPGSQTASYNNLNQLTNLSGQTLSYDSNGNLLSDGQRSYSWDAENRLVGISYPGQPGKQTDFAYDGLGRRTAIASTPSGGGSAVTKSYLWCGIRICQARDATNSPTRGYYDEGEFAPGTPASTYYYGADQIGSVRRAFASATNAPAYSYDPYGIPLQGTAFLTDFGYAGMFYNADSGLYLTQYRVYDPVAGRWLSRDPMGELGDPAANLYRFVNGNPITLVDPNGSIGIVPIIAISAAGGAVSVGLADLAIQLANSGGNIACVNPWEVAGAAGAGAVAGAIVAGGAAGAWALYGARASGLGDLTIAEVNLIQRIVNQAGRPLDVVGSAARGARRPGSDIDYTTANANIPNYTGLANKLPGIDRTHGILRGSPEGISIRFEPNVPPF
jgi:RHS repeat-associated protein